MTGIVKTDQLQGAQGTTVTVPTGHTLAVTSNATIGGNLTVDTNTLHVDASNNRVGIGASNNSSYDANARNVLIADESGNTGLTIRSGSSSNYGMIHFADGVSSADEYRAGRIVYEHSSNSMQFSTANTLNLMINGNGVVTTPKNPMMLAQGGRTVISTGITDFWYLALPERYDTTNSYDASTGIFTAPVAGKYFVYSHLKMSSSQSNAHFSVSVNNAYQGGGGGYDANNAWQIQTGDYMQWTGMVNVSANDTIRMVLYPNGVNSALDTGTNRNHFVVYLVG